MAAWWGRVVAQRPKSSLPLPQERLPLWQCLWCQHIFTPVPSCAQGLRFPESRGVSAPFPNPTLHPAQRLMPRSCLVNTGQGCWWKMFQCPGALTMPGSAHGLTPTEGVRTWAELVPPPDCPLEVTLLCFEKQIPDSLFSYHWASSFKKFSMCTHLCMCEHMWACCVCVCPLLYTVIFKGLSKCN